MTIPILFLLARDDPITIIENGLEDKDDFSIEIEDEDDDSIEDQK